MRQRGGADASNLSKVTNQSQFSYDEEDFDYHHGSYDDIIVIIVIYCCKNSYKLPDHYNLIVFDLSGNF